MWRTTKDIDKFVCSVVSGLSEDERNRRGLNISILYYNIGEYNKALEYIQRYIQSDDTKASAYKLLGQCYEKLKRPDKQLAAYQRSLELDKKQTELLVEACKLKSNELSDGTSAKAEPKSHNETRQFELNQSINDSFVSANSRSDLNESVHCLEREVETATPTPAQQISYDKLERLMHKMMDSLNIVKDDISEVRNCVQNIEERLQKQEEVDVDDVDILGDYYLDEALRGQNPNLNNTSMMGNVSRNQTISQQTPKSSQLAKNNVHARGTPNSTFPHQSPMSMNNPYNMNPLLNNMFCQMQMNPYQAALVNVAGQGFGQAPQLPPNFQQSPILPYGNDVYNLQQQLFAQQLVNDQRNSNFAGLLLQQQQQQHAAQQNLSQLPSNMVPQSYAPANPLVSNAVTTNPPSVVPMLDGGPRVANLTPIKNTPVEKGPPVNVVITSSDPVPQNITTFTQQAPNFSVTIPPQHIKNNPAAVQQPIGAALANPTITAALTQVKKPQSPSHSIINNNITTSTATVPTTQEQKSIFGNLPNPFSSTPFSSPGSKITPEVKKTETLKTEALQSNNTPSADIQSKVTFLFSNIGHSIEKNEFGDQFKLKEGEWSCKGCYTKNTAETLHCLCCEAPKDDTVPKKAPANVFGSSNAGAPKFSFGNLSAAQNTPTSTSSAAAKFGSSSFSFSFGSQGTTTTQASKPAEPTVPKTDLKFNFVFQEKSPAKPSTTVAQKEGVEDVSDDENVPEEESTAYFAPVIPLPDKVEVKTGEEDENVLYSHRAKLYRFREKQWRERGLGDVKILQHKENGTLRVVMRREQIHKICLNHVLTSEIEYKPKDAKSWQFVAIDFSEGALEPDHFSLRFKSDEIAREFRAAIDGALAGSLPAINGNAADQPDTASTVTEEERKNIINLQLPNNFYDNANQARCAGCRGCNPDEFEFSEVKDTNHLQVDDNPLPLVPPKKVETAHNDLSKETMENDSKSANNNEDVLLFRNHAKLYRFSGHLDEWKTFGSGFMNVVVNEGNPNQFRLIMHSECALDLLLNQCLNKNTRFNETSLNERALTWCKHKLSLVLFKTVEIRDQFYDVVSLAQKKMASDKSQPANATPVESAKNQVAKPTNKAATEKNNSNGNPSEKNGLCCEAPKDETVPKREPAIGSIAPESKGSFEIQLIAVEPVEKPASKVMSVAMSGFSENFYRLKEVSNRSWKCRMCGVFNTSDATFCIYCFCDKNLNILKHSTPLRICWQCEYCLLHNSECYCVSCFNACPKTNENWVNNPTDSKLLNNYKEFLTGDKTQVKVEDFHQNVATNYAKDAVAMRILGHCHGTINDLEKQLKCYDESIELEHKQKTIYH